MNPDHADYRIKINHQVYTAIHRKDHKYSIVAEVPVAELQNLREPLIS